MKLDKTKVLEIIENAGIQFPKEFVFTRTDWEDLHGTLEAFKKRVLGRRPSIEQATKADELPQCPFCDKIDTINDGFCQSCGKLVEPPEPA